MKVNPVVSNYLSSSRVQSVNEHNYLASKNYQNKNLLNNSSQDISFGSGVVTEALKLVGKALKKIYSKPEVFTDVIEPTLQKSTYTKQNINTVIEYFNSNAGKKIQRKLEHDINGNFFADTRFLYKPNSKNNELLKTFNYDKDGNLLWETRYKYNEAGRKIKTTNIDKDGNILSISDYEYVDGEIQHLMYVVDKTPEGEVWKKTKYFRDPVDGEYVFSSESSSNPEFISNFIRNNKDIAFLPDNFSDGVKFDDLKIKEFSIYYDAKGQMNNLEYKFETSEQPMKKHIDILTIGLKNNNEVDKYFLHTYDLNVLRQREDGFALYSANGILKEVSNRLYDKKYYEDGKTIKEIYENNLVVNKKVLIKEFYPNGQLKTDYDYSLFYGGSGSRGIPKLAITKYSEDGKRLSVSENYINVEDRRYY